MEADGLGEKTKVLKIKPIVHLIEECVDDFLSLE